MAKRLVLNKNSRQSASLSQSVELLLDCIVLGYFVIGLEGLLLVATNVQVHPLHLGSLLSCWASFWFEDPPGTLGEGMGGSGGQPHMDYTQIVKMTFFS